MENTPSTVKVDSKAEAGLTFFGVIEESRTFFPDERFHPTERKSVNLEGLIDAHGYSISSKADGTGTKPETAERLFDATGNIDWFEGPAHDVTAMNVDDNARDGKFTLAVVNSLDVNSAENKPFVAALARGQLAACKKARVALLNGETAELGARTPGYGKHHLN